MVSVKRMLVEALGEHASTVLLDPNFSFPGATLALRDGGAGHLLAQQWFGEMGGICRNASISWVMLSGGVTSSLHFGLETAFTRLLLIGYFDDLCRVSSMRSRATGTRMRRNRRHRAGRRRGSVSMCRRLAATTVWTMGTVANRPHTVARSPAAVGGTVGFIVIQTDAHAAVVAIAATVYGAAGRQDREQPDCEGER